MRLLTINLGAKGGIKPEFCCSSPLVYEEWFRDDNEACTARRRGARTVPPSAGAPRTLA